MKKNLLVTILVCIALAICAAVMIPFSKDSVATVEGLVKFAIFPLFIIGTSLFSLVIRKYNADCDKVCVYSTTLPITAYMAPGFVYFLTLAIRNHGEGWIATLICSIVAFLGLTFISVMIPKYELHKKSDKVAPWSAIVLYTLVAAYSMFACVKVSTLKEGDFSNASTVALIVAIVVAVLFTVANFVEYFVMSNKYVMEIEEAKQEEAKEAPVQEKIVEKIVYVEKPVEVIKEVEKIVEVEKPVEVIKEVEKIVEVEKPVEVIKEVEKIVEVEKKPEPKVKVVKEKAVINPDATAMKKYLTDNFNDIVILEGKDPENFKVKRKGKVILIVQRTTNDYRITFQRKPISATKYMIKYPNACIKAASPAGEQWFKITNKGEIEEADVLAILGFSHKYMEDLEAKALAKKEKAKERIKLKKQKAKEAAKAKAQAAKEKQKAKEAKAKKAA